VYHSTLGSRVIKKKKKVQVDPTYRCFLGTFFFFFFFFITLRPRVE